ncbi:hypothetical protein A3D81_02310 [Candidatus Curtissbacteria bacterium RIFCSPHIGHO2_02_FULL_40_17]|uniref:Membrane insertase YidC/Oxa/ALB C-terminal domain-containing protein n=3 Tax=Candidatus Curtissiibacteriota TaxID=1752717 RepID=A0A1F5GH76_9BACT|nr:MAG: hypothetical protein A2693_00145 [Candidatus Curtissbacteria bacterium RIFCSPHIGHO2_01_FULL_40_12]OGD91204.1 MAG: hypothetical protein A3D81_02310 [Candidatus Curtissbacteria bacterium RIFCSPHIGHO2_02_FULL_40_17]OGE03219.1 MAG: hypothetical protein A3F45_04260 [Candidatus Curtissbacteria bacterium RIFCSPHIGHO2_12_FULL_41_17]
MNPFDSFLINPILNLLLLFYKGFALLPIPGALGFAIILLTVVIRLALWPLISAQLKSTQKMAALKPHLDRIKSEHGHDKTRHQQEVSKLYKEHGVNPLAGCLPLIIQMPVFIALYQVLLKIVDFSKNDFLTNINDRLYSPFLFLEKIPDPSYLGVSLAAKPSDWRTVGFLILLVPIVTGILQYIQSKMMSPSAKSPAPVKKEGKEGLEDSMAQMQSQMILIMPAMIAFFSYGFPIGLSLYWNTFTIIGIIQQYIIAGAGGLNKYLPEKWRK